MGKRRQGRSEALLDSIEAEAQRRIYAAQDRLRELSHLPVADSADQVLQRFGGAARYVKAMLTAGAHYRVAWGDVRMLRELRYRVEPEKAADGRPGLRDLVKRADQLRATAVSAELLRIHPTCAAHERVMFFYASVLFFRFSTRGSGRTNSWSEALDVGKVWEELEAICNGDSTDSIEMPSGPLPWELRPTGDI